MSEQNIHKRAVSLVIVATVTVMVFSTQRFYLRAQGTSPPTDARASWERLDARSVAAQTDDEDQVRELVHGVFEPFSWSHGQQIQGRIEERISRAEVAYRNRVHAPVPEENVVKTFNNLAEKLGTPEFTKTDLRQVRYLRLSLMTAAPHLVGAASAGQSDGSMPRIMSPAEAAYVTLSLVHQKLYNPKYQVTSRQWADDRDREDWERWHDYRSGKRDANPVRPRLISVSISYDSAEGRKAIVGSVAARLASGAATDVVENALDDLGVSR